MEKPIPANLITGFLGAGKTTAILHLLATKPDHEIWGVLVNEFGEIGIDGAMMAGKGAVVREVPGGCMCCVAGLPMQIGLNMLIARSKPDRILIEPTGLGHPEQVLNILTGEYYRDVLDLKAMVCLLDPRQLSDPRYRENDNFRDQIALSDVLVANKVDCCSEDDKTTFSEFCKRLEPAKSKTGWVSEGRINPEWLELPRVPRQAIKPDAHHHHTENKMPETASLSLSESELFIRRENKGQGHFSCGWLYHEQLIFSYDQLFDLFSCVDVDRLKAVVRTDQGIKAFNAQQGVMTVLELDDCDQSRVELIHDQPLPWSDIEIKLCEAAGLVRNLEINSDS